MRTRAFLQNSIFTALLQLITMLSGFLVPRLMLSAYGSETNGLVTSINQFLIYFNLVEAGLAGAAVYALYKPLAAQNSEEVNSILTATKKFYYKIGTYFVLLVLVLSMLYPLFVKTTNLTNFEVSMLVTVLGCSGAINYFLMAKYRVLLTASQKVYVISMASICHIVLYTIIIVVLSYFKVNIVILEVVAISSVLLRSIILKLYVNKYFKSLNYNGIPNYNALNKKWDALYLQILGSIHSGAPIVIATIFTNLKLVSVYSIYNMVFVGLSGILSIFTSGLSASFGDVIARKEIQTLQKSYNEFEYSYYMIIAWAYSTTLILIMPFINVYTTGINDTEYYFPILGFLFTLNGLLYNLKTPQGMLVISAGMFKETRIQTTIQGLIVVIGSIIFVQFWGLSGILIGLCLSNLYRTIDLLFFVPRNITKLSPLPSVFRMIRVILTISVCYLPFNYIELSPNTLIDWLIEAIFVASYCFMVTILVNFIIERKIFYNIVSRLVQTVSEKIKEKG